MIPFAANADATAAAKIANAFEWPGQPRKLPHLLGDLYPSNTWFLRPTQVFIQDGMYTVSQKKRPPL